jgi:penicillin-binding protein 2
MCLIGNKGYYYTPHIVDSISDGDTVLNKYRIRHVTTHIPDDIFEKVKDGMQGVVEEGTGQQAQVPGIIVCGKTGTAQNSYKGVQQKDHALFAAFAPKDNPRIAIVVICENSGMGGNSAAPIAGLMIEKYLKDSIADNRKELMERMINTNLIPPRIYEARDSLAKLRALRAAQKREEEAVDDSVAQEEAPATAPIKAPTPAPAKAPGTLPAKPPLHHDTTRRRDSTPVALLDEEKKHKPRTGR